MRRRNQSYYQKNKRSFHKRQRKQYRGRQSDQEWYLFEGVFKGYLWDNGNWEAYSEG